MIDEKFGLVLDTAYVVRIVDADTLEVEWHGNRVDVRLLLVDAPETVAPDEVVEKLGPEARIFTEDTLLGKCIQLEYDGPRWDHYGRLLAYVWVDGKLFNEMLLAEGLANLAFVYHPPYKYYYRLARAQMKARDAWKGIWGVGELN